MPRFFSLSAKGFRTLMRRVPISNKTRMSPFDSLLLFDGATGTEYQKHGLASGSPPEIFTRDRPEIVAALHRAYAEAGAQVVETNTFGANALRLAKHGLAAEVAYLNATAVRIARASVPVTVLVAGSVGPLGAVLEPYGELTEEEARRHYGEQMRALVAAGVDLILIETMLSLREAAVVCETARECGAPAVGVTLTFDESAAGPRTAFGESPEECHRILREAGADLIGGNCGSGLEVMRRAGEAFLRCSTLPILLQPNAGLPEYAGGSIRYPVTPGEFAFFAAAMAGAGIRGIGGCCGTGPEHIRKAGEELGRR